MSIPPPSPAEPPSVPAAGPRPFWLRATAVAAFVVGALALLHHASEQRPRLRGDAWEYWYQSESFHRHGSPELRQEDMEAVNREATKWSPDAPPERPYAYEPSKDGRWYGVHFWTYALSAVPAREYLRLTGRSELGGLGLASAGWFALAVGVALFGSAKPVGERLTLAGLSAVGPVLWYLSWPGPETFCWALALIAVVLYRDRRDGWAGAAAGLAATQNPTLVFLGGAAVLAAAWERRWRTAAAAAAGTAVGLLPYAFYQYHYGTPNLIASEHAKLANLSWVRTWGLVADLNQGLLPYVPLLVLGAAAGAVRLAYTRNARGLFLLAGGIGMALGVEVAHNWNSDSEGLHRYLVWMIPAAAGVAVEGFAGWRRLWVYGAAAVAAHAAILVAFDRYHGLKNGYLGHTPVAEWVLTHHPWAYWVEDEVFVERTQHRDGWPHAPADFPLGYVREDGAVTKILLDRGSVDRVGVKFEADPEYLAALRERAEREEGLFYAHPPAGAVGFRPPAPPR